MNSVKYKLKRWNKIPQSVFRIYKNKNNQQRLGRILKFIPKGASCLEVGCGLGYQAGVVIKHRSPNYYSGFDIVDSYVRSCIDMIKTNGFKVGQFYVDDITALNSSISRNPYNIILCNEVLEHIPNYEKAIEGLSALCVERTKIIFTVPRHGKMTRVKGHVNNFKKEDLCKHFDGAGLFVKHHEYVGKLYSLFILKKL